MLPGPGGRLHPRPDPRARPRWSTTGLGWVRFTYLPHGGQPVDRGRGGHQDGVVLAGHSTAKLTLDTYGHLMLLMQLGRSGTGNRALGYRAGTADW